MSSRNSLMTNVIYDEKQIAAVGELLGKYVEQLTFIGKEVGFYAGRLDATGGLDWGSLTAIYCGLDEISSQDVDVIVHCDDDMEVWHRLKFAEVGL